MVFGIPAAITNLSPGHPAFRCHHNDWPECQLQLASAIAVSIMHKKI